jgi:hypothetical protein
MNFKSHVSIKGCLRSFGSLTENQQSYKEGVFWEMFLEPSALSRASCLREEVGGNILCRVRRQRSSKEDESIGRGPPGHLGEAMKAGGLAAAAGGRVVGSLGRRRRTIAPVVRLMTIVLLRPITIVLLQPITIVLLRRITIVLLQPITTGQ